MTNWSTHPAITKLQNKSICIIGLAREGLATYHFLRAALPNQIFSLADRQSLEQLSPEWFEIKKTDQLLEWKLGDSYLSELEKSEVLFITPGIRTDQPPIQQALSHGCQLHSNTQLFFELCPCPIIGITGTKGKSTTSSVIHHVLVAGGLDAVLLGNIGTPPLSGLDNLTEKSLAVVELSCHQLQHLPYSPHISVIQDITTEHLDYYPTTEAYVAAKSAIASHQTSDDLVIFNRDFTNPTKIAKLGSAKQLTFSLTTHASSEIVWLDGGTICYHGEALMSANQIPLPGKHNLLNIIPSIIIGKHYGLSNQQIADGILSFRSLPHRLEFVGEVDGVRYFNDSLATEPNATISAIEAFAGNPIVLLAGGYERHQDYTELAQKIVSANIKALILFPTTGERLLNDVQAAAQAAAQSAGATHIPEYFFITTMQEAITATKKLALAGDVVLLSPAAASFNTFKDYRDRGEQFKKLLEIP